MCINKDNADGGTIEAAAKKQLTPPPLPHLPERRSARCPSSPVVRWMPGGQELNGRRRIDPGSEPSQPADAEVNRQLRAPP